MSLPSPLVIWGLALAALAIGLRTGRPRRRETGARIPAAIRLAAAVPVPAALADRAGGVRLRRAAVTAGLTERDTDLVARSRLVGAAAGLALGGALAVAHPLGLIVGGAAAAAGWMWPVLWVLGRARHRRARIVMDLPDLVDLVVICAESGMALEPSIRLATERLRGPLPAELARTLRELDLGTPRRAAYGGLADRVDAPEVTGLVGALLQADELGAPIAATLRRQGDLMRSARRQDVRDAAARAAPKVQLVVALVMVPAALLLVVGVFVLQLIGQIATVAGGVT